MIFSLSMYKNQVMQICKFFSLVVILFLMTGISSCKKALKHVSDYYPQIKLNSATIQADGSVLVQGTKISDGAASVDNIGFCCGTAAKPNLVSRQIICTQNGSSFTASYVGLSVDSAYYFTAWATNTYGYVFSNTISLSGIQATPVVPPCSFVENYVDLGTGTDQFLTVGTPVYNSGGYTFTASTANGSSLNFTFGSAVGTGTYTTTSSTTPGPGQVYFYYYAGSISASTTNGGMVYVNRITPGVYDITICTATATDGTSNYTVKMRMKTPT
jgi:hypothetical protein